MHFDKLSAICSNLDKSKILLFGNGLTLHHIISGFTTLMKKLSENIVGKGENAGNQHFLLFHNIFYPIKPNRYRNLSSIVFKSF